MKKWIVLIDWADGDVEDTDEVAVKAANEAEALIKVISEWSAKTLPDWPNCMIKSITVSGAKRIRPLA